MPIDGNAARRTDEEFILDLSLTCAAIGAGIVTSPAGRVVVVSDPAKLRIDRVTRRQTNRERNYDLTDGG
jgi:hypothetical protein